MLKNTVFVILLIISLLLIFAVGDARSANNVTLTKLKNIPDSQIASCTVKSNDFQFLCLLNTKNYSSCKFMIGSSFTLPKCEFCDSVDTPTKEPTIKPATPKSTNPLFDAIRQSQINNKKAKESPFGKALEKNKVKM